MRTTIRSLLRLFLPGVVILGVAGSALPVTATHAGASTPLPLGLKPGTYHVTFTFHHGAKEAVFTGGFGSMSFSGVSVQSRPDADDFRVSGTADHERFSLNLSVPKSLSLSDLSGLPFTLTGSVGTTRVNARAELKENGIGFSGRVGTAEVSGKVAPTSLTGTAVTGTVTVR